MNFLENVPIFILECTVQAHVLSKMENGIFEDLIKKAETFWIKISSMGHFPYLPKVNFHMERTNILVAVKIFTQISYMILTIPLKH